MCHTKIVNRVYTLNSSLNLGQNNSFIMKIGSGQVLFLFMIFLTHPTLVVNYLKS